MEKEGWQKHKNEMRKALKDSLAKETEDSWNQFLNENSDLYDYDIPRRKNKR